MGLDAGLAGLALLIAQRFAEVMAWLGLRLGIGLGLGLRLGLGLGLGAGVGAGAGAGAGAWFGFAQAIASRQSTTALGGSTWQGLVRDIGEI